MNSAAFESKWDRSKRLETAFAAWCQKIAAALGGVVEAPRSPEDVTRWNTVRLPDGLSFCLHLVGYESRVSVSGDWPKDGNNQTVTPRDAILYDTEAAKIYVGAEREPSVVAKDITRRFLPTYRTQHAACLERVAGRNEYQDKVTANAHRIAAVLGIAQEDVSVKDGEACLFPHREGLYQVRITEGVRFELSLPVEKAEQVLRLLLAESEASK